MTGGLKVTIYDYLRVVFHRKWHIAVSITLVMALAGVYAFFLAREVWSATNQRIRVLDRLGRPLTKKLFSDEDLKQRIYTIKQQLSSKVKAEEVYTELLRRPQFAGLDIDFDRSVELYLDSMKMELRGEFVAVEIEAYHAELARELMDILVREMIAINDQDERSNMEMSDDVVTRTYRDILDQLDEAKKQYYDVDQSKVEAIMSGDPAAVLDLPKPPVGVGSTNSDVVFYTTWNRLGEARRQLDDVERSVSERNGQLKSLERELDATPKRIEGDVVVQQNERAKLLREEIDKHRHELHQMLVDRRENHPMVIDQRAKIAALERALQTTPSEIPHQRSTTPNPRLHELQNRVSEVRADLVGLEQKREVLKGQIAQLAQTFEMAYREMGERQMLLDRIQALTLRLRQVRDIHGQVEVERAFNFERYQFESKDKTIISEGPVRPNKPLVMLMGLMLGIVTAGGVVFIVEYADHSIKGIEDARRFLDLPVFAAIPLFGPEADSKGGVASDMDRDKPAGSGWLGNLAGAAAVIALLVGAGVWTFRGDDELPPAETAETAEVAPGDATVDEATGTAGDPDDPAALPSTSRSSVLSPAAIKSLAPKPPAEPVDEAPDPGALWSSPKTD